METFLQLRSGVPIRLWCRCGEGRDHLTVPDLPSALRSADASPAEVPDAERPDAEQIESHVRAG